MAGAVGRLRRARPTIYQRINLVLLNVRMSLRVRVGVTGSMGTFLAVAGARGE